VALLELRALQPGGDEQPRGGDRREPGEPVAEAEGPDLDDLVRPALDRLAAPAGAVLEDDVAGDGAQSA
jgi:hypothetical protein